MWNNMVDNRPENSEFVYYWITYQNGNSVQGYGNYEKHGADFTIVDLDCKVRYFNNMYILDKKIIVKWAYPPE
jgi:hypothetical protein